MHVHGACIRRWIRYLQQYWCWLAPSCVAVVASRHIAAAELSVTKCCCRCMCIAQTPHSPASGSKIMLPAAVWLCICCWLAGASASSAVQSLFGRALLRVTQAAQQACVSTGFPFLPLRFWSKRRHFCEPS
jgi:hypothetical protein